MNPYNPEFIPPIFYFDQSITSDKYSFLRFTIIIYLSYSAITRTRKNKEYLMVIPGRDHILMGSIRNEERI